MRKDLCKIPSFPPGSGKKKVIVASLPSPPALSIGPTDKCTQGTGAGVWEAEEALPKSSAKTSTPLPTGLQLSHCRHLPPSPLSQALAILSGRERSQFVCNLTLSCSLCGVPLESCNKWSYRVVPPPWPASLIVEGDSPLGLHTYHHLRNG